MVMIVFWHFMRHGFPMYFSGDDTGNYQFSFLEYSVLAFLCCHVNCFVFISGYYGISINRKKIISFLTMTTFYGVFTYGLKVVLDNQFTIGEVVKSILPISSEGWWFFSYYFVLMLLSPFLNEGIERRSSARGAAKLCVSSWISRKRRASLSIARRGRRTPLQLPVFQGLLR